MPGVTNRYYANEDRIFGKRPYVVDSLLGEVHSFHSTLVEASKAARELNNRELRKARMRLQPLPHEIREARKSRK